jgi:hypothetical protein
VGEDKNSKKKAPFKGLKEMLSVIYMLASIVRIVIELLSH